MRLSSRGSGDKSALREARNCLGKIGTISGAQLTHHGRVLGLNLVHHPRLARLPVRIFVHAQVFFGQFVDVRIRALLGDFNYAAAR